MFASSLKNRGPPGLSPSETLTQMRSLVWLLLWQLSQTVDTVSIFAFVSFYLMWFGSLEGAGAGTVSVTVLMQTRSLRWQGFSVWESIASEDDSRQQSLLWPKPVTIRLMSAVSIIYLCGLLARNCQRPTQWGCLNSHIRFLPVTAKGLVPSAHKFTLVPLICLILCQNHHLDIRGRTHRGPTIPHCPKHNHPSRRSVGVMFLKNEPFWWKSCR